MSNVNRRKRQRQKRSLSRELKSPFLGPRNMFGVKDPVAREAVNNIERAKRLA